MTTITIQVDPKLLARAIKLSGAKSKREAVELALRGLVDRVTLYADLRAARGSLKWEGDLGSWRRSRT